MKEDELSSWEMKESVMGMSRSSISVWTPPSVERMFIVFEGWRFRTNVTKAFGSASDCYIRQVIEDSQAVL